MKNLRTDEEPTARFDNYSSLEPSAQVLSYRWAITQTQVSIVKCFFIYVLSYAVMLAMKRLQLYVASINTLHFIFIDLVHIMNVYSFHYVLINRCD